MNIEEIFPDGRWATEDEYVIRCPICSDGNHDHCYLRPEKGVYHCKYNGCSGTLSWLIRMFGVEGRYTYQPRSERPLKEAVKKTKFDEFCKVTGREGDLDRKILLYLENRGIFSPEIRKYDIRYAPCGRYFGRVIIPIIDERKIVCFSARAVFPGIKPKYLYPKTGETPLTTGEAVFGLDIAKKSKKHCVIVEGVFDSMAINRKTRDFVGLALLSKNMSKGQCRKILSLSRITNRKQIYLMLDADAYSDTLKIAKCFYEYGRSVMICRLQEGDPDSASEAELYQALDSAKEYSYELAMSVLLEKQHG